ncbi:hypothetical protein ACF0H5_019932 [Mactra antiquata]
MVGDRWSPVVEPHGLMSCVKCQCAQLNGRVVCKNIRKECPVTVCQTPIRRSGTCCAVCPGEDTSFEDSFHTDRSHTTPDKTSGVDDNDNDDDNSDDDDDNIDVIDMSAVLVGGGKLKSRQRPIRTRAVAMIHLSDITSDSLKYAIRFSKLNNPIYLKITDEYGTVMIEERLPRQKQRSGRIYGKISGIQDHFIQYIIHHQAYVVITTSRNRKGEIIGKLRHNSMARVVTFEALLNPTRRSGTGALVAFYYDVISKVASFVIQMEGLKYSKITSGDYFVTLEKDTEILHQNMLQLSKQVQSNASQETTTSLILQRPSRSKSGWKDFCVLTQNITSNKMVTGIYKRMRARDIVLLLNVDIRVKMIINERKSVTADVNTLQTHDQSLFEGQSIILRSTNCDTIIIMIYDVTKECSRLKYHIITSELHENVPSLTITLDSLGGRTGGSIGRINDEMYHDLNEGKLTVHLSLSDGLCDHFIGKRGNVNCEEILCPINSCNYPVQRENECCPVCIEDNETERKYTGSCYFDGDKRWHEAGSTWYPYVPPFGYSKCAMCTCEAGTLEINCTRLPCPELTCPKSQRIRLKMDDCCQVCTDRERKPTLGIPSVIVRTTSPKLTEECSFGGAIYKHGDKWHPVLQPFGEMKCYTCSCKNGKSRCKKKKCPVLDCRHQYRPSGQCCPICSETRSTKPRYETPTGVDITR